MQTIRTSHHRLLDFMGNPPVRALTGPQLAGYFMSPTQAPTNTTESNAAIGAARSYTNFGSKLC